MTEQADTILVSWFDTTIPQARLKALLQRGHSLALAMEKWQRAGIWVVTRSDANYPWRLKQKLKNQAPPVLFGCGNKALLNSGGIAVVGSRNAIDHDLIFTEQLARQAAFSGYAIVSGGARGIDTSAMSAAIQSAGRVVGIIADNLLKAATSNQWREGLMQGNLVLLSPFYPESAFSIVNAMARNKYIYCLADTAIVVHSGIKGGTWSGAVENLKHQWTPLWIKSSDDINAGNPGLVDKGGHPLTDQAKDIDINMLSTAPLSATEQQGVLFPNRDNVDSVSAGRVTDAGSADEITLDFFQLFIKKMKQIARTPKTLDDVVEETALTKAQANEWIKKAVQEEILVKLSHPVRFQWKQH
ncbi:DNA-processing protein DprA [Rouxiella aceris]|uniref:DNA-processing protein DprA n=1 Tax=Rouxiella aceris TaxID=2703884 RepID=UPI002852858D|nr:DNA-processing protein DprA [Rouxiella aceris]